jgi:hypothetical protein
MWNFDCLPSFFSSSSLHVSAQLAILMRTICVLKTSAVLLVYCSCLRLFLCWYRATVMHISGLFFWLCGRLKHFCLCWSGSTLLLGHGSETWSQIHKVQQDAAILYYGHCTALHCYLRMWTQNSIEPK